MSGTLYLVATPIGNLADISKRAADVLASADLIACEDTRHTRKLLTHLGISAKTVSYHEHNERERSVEIIDRLTNGGSVALVSDAGTPAISDPGHHLVRSAIEAGVMIISVPGPAAFVTAAIVSGLPTDSLFFGGFLPSRKTDRANRLEQVREIPATLAFYESPHRLEASIRDCIRVLGDREAAVAREMTKLHEEVLRGKLSEILSAILSAKPRGEIVLLIDREHATVSADAEAGRERLPTLVAEYENDGMDRRSALKKAAKELGIPRSEAYRMLHSL